MGSTYRTLPQQIESLTKEGKADRAKMESMGKKVAALVRENDLYLK